MALLIGLGTLFDIGLLTFLSEPVGRCCVVIPSSLLAGCMAGDFLGSVLAIMTPPPPICAEDAPPPAGGLKDTVELEMVEARPLLAAITMLGVATGRPAGPTTVAPPGGSDGKSANSGGGSCVIEAPNGELIDIIDVDDTTAVMGAPFPFLMKCNKTVHDRVGELLSGKATKETWLV